jgi:hypothetical protein
MGYLIRSVFSEGSAKCYQGNLYACEEYISAISEKADNSGEN